MLASVLQVVGAVLVAVAAFLVAPWLGFAVAGVAAIVFGLAMERGATIEDDRAR
jgi:hypothetical protein